MIRAVAAPLHAPALRSPWRMLAAAGAIGEAVAHIPVTQEHLSQAPYIGAGFVLLTIAGFLLAHLQLTADNTAVWGATLVTSALALAGYLLSRTIGLPQIHDDIGNWTDPLGLVAITTEAIMLLTATAELAGPRAHTVGPRMRWIALMPAAAVLLTGCAAALAAGPTGWAAASPMTGMQMTPGMIMPDGSTMGPAPAPSTHHAAAPAGPSPAAAMICSAKTRTGIGDALALPGPPAASATWRNHMYTCTYRLPFGPLILSVTETGGPAATSTQMTTLRQLLGHADKLAGLTPGAFGTADGRVVLNKDNNVLDVDATGLPAVFGRDHEQRAAFAYEIASDILGCWTGD